MKKQIYPCLAVIADEHNAEDLPWTLQDLGAVSVESRDESTMTAEQMGKVLMIAGFSDAETRNEAAHSLSKNSNGIKVSIKDVKDDGWSTAWRDFFKPVVFDTLQIITPWMKPPRDDRKTIVLDPGQAFGTGGHATTKLLVSMLERRASAGTLPQRVLDVGIGSGVLSIAAVKLGVNEALGVDIDEESIVATVDNAEVNGVGDKIKALLGTAHSLDGQWPLVLANIELSVFLKHAVDIAPLVELGGELLVSGLLKDQVTRCTKLWPGFEVKETDTLDDWASIALRRFR